MTRRIMIRRYLINVRLRILNVAFASSVHYDEQEDIEQWLLVKKKANYTGYQMKKQIPTFSIHQETSIGEIKSYHERNRPGYN
uniref:Transposase n=1 Tax=Strongyloides venezuelensis TaxID=75913 RepID=A0A0K0FSU6_STRVS